MTLFCFLIRGSDVSHNGRTIYAIQVFIWFISAQVVIKDFVSRAIISQFRAHTSPISALCFDPSGTLLVTASVHGNNINIFRILPNSSQNESGSQSFNWNSAHVHLYKLHRGMTSAVSFPYPFSHFCLSYPIVFLFYFVVSLTGYTRNFV